MNRHEIHAFKKVLLSMILIMLATALLYAANGELDASFRPAIGDGVNGKEINALAALPDGKIIVGGTFEILNGVLKNRLARFNADGSLDANFYLELKDDVKRIFVQPNGQILVAGASTLFRLNADGSPDNNFNSRVYGTVESASFQSDGKIIIGGRFSIAGSSRQWVARLNADGSVDESFNVSLTFGGTVPSVNAVLVQPDGKVYVGGIFSTVNGVSRRGLVRLNADGSLDETFPPQMIDNFQETVSFLARQPDGKILVSGNFNAIQGAARNKFARLNADGTLDASFVPIATDALSSFLLQPDGRILINTNTIRRLNADGSADATFVAVASVGKVFALLPDGKVLSSISNSEDPNRIASITTISRLSASGTLESSFQIRKGATGSIINATLVQPDGKILIGGHFSVVGNENRVSLARLNRDGTVDASFNPQGFGDAIIYALALQPDGKILVGGIANHERTNQGFDQGNGVLRLNPNGSRDESFSMKKITAGSPVHVRTLAVQTDGKIYVGGSFQTYDDVQTNGFVRLNADGALDNSFTLRPGNGSIVNKIIVQPDGKILVGGKILPYGTTNFRYALERFNPDNTVDASFNSNLVYSGSFSDPFVSSIALLPDGKILYADTRLKRLNQNGSADGTFTSILPEYPDFGFKRIAEITVQPNGKILIGGDFLKLNGENHNSIARLNRNGTLDSSFRTQIPRWGARDPDVLTISMQTDGKILFGGFFGVVNGVLRTSLARLAGDVPNSDKTPFDFDGDGRSDVSVYRAGTWYLQQSAAGFGAVTWGTATDLLTPADFDGDGKTDFALFRSSEGTWKILYSSGIAYSAIQFGLSGDLPVPGDYDGDGKADISVFRPSNGYWYRLNSSNNQFVAVQFGQNGDVPVVADFDGDGKSDIAVWRPVNGVWYRLNSSDESFAAVQFGSNGDKPTPADFDGDGKTDVAVFRPSNGVWYRLSSSDNSFSGVGFGIAEDKPSAADYDGDGRADVAVFRPSTGMWYILRSTQGFSAQSFGISGDLSIPNSLVR